MHRELWHTGNMALSYIARLQVSCSMNPYKSTGTIKKSYFDVVKKKKKTKKNPQK